MKKVILLFLFGLFYCSMYSQVIYESKTTLNNDGERTKENHSINVSDSKITISNFVGGTRTLVLKVNEIEKNGEYNWYHCTSTEIDYLTNKTINFLVSIKADNPDFIIVRQNVSVGNSIQTVFEFL